MVVTAIAQAPSTAAVLPRTGISDAFRLFVYGSGLDAATASHRVFARAPHWIARLLRNAIVAPPGLKGAAPAGRGETTPGRQRNGLGRAYLVFVMPFHRMIVPAMLARAGLV